ncbi:uncharacterized protein LOC125858997 [Solanum stenotomum]|uniref:uncharacterized protein LOC125858997 n=1 Tax=Solanum stenotomum TaxID=172797 RepID=UPI0020D1A184|nr:uncharacterized protein LOC125858997 [Solanum stenotomum]
MERSEYKPISLIGSTILAGRLKKVIGKLVSNHQNAFIEERQITVASLIANHVLDWQQKQVNVGLLCKLDIENAFDRMNCSYLISILMQRGFGERWIKWITFNISTVKYPILVNRSPDGFFSPQRGLRQGEPLSHFMFQ